MENETLVEYLNNFLKPILLQVNVNGIALKEVLEILKGTKALEVPTLPKQDNPKLDMTRIYSFVKKDGTPNICNKCGGLFSWDLRPERIPPLHVNADGKIKGTGDCPNYQKVGY